MQIDKQNSTNIVPRPATGSVAGRQDPRIAQQHLVTLPTRLALMRWTRGGDIPHVLTPGREMTRREAWYGRMQHDFQSWLETGGFHQVDGDRTQPK